MKRLLSLVALLGLAILLVAPMTVSAADNKDQLLAALKAIIDAENKHDLNAVMAMYADNAVVTAQDPGNDFKPKTYKGKDQIKQFETPDPTMMDTQIELEPDPVVTGNDVTTKFKIHDSQLKAAGLDPAEGIAFITFDKNFKVSQLTIQYVPTWVVKARKAMASMPAAGAAQAGTKNLPATGDAADTLTLALPFGLAGAALLFFGLRLRRPRRLTL